MITTKLTFDATGWLEINYLNDGVVVQSTSYHPTQLDLIQADCTTHGVEIEGDDAEAVALWIAAYVPPAPPVLTLADFDSALTAHLDSTANQRQYDNRITCAVRAGYPGPFQAEGQAFAQWMDACNFAAYTLLAEVQAGTTPMPESPAAFIAMLPVMVWPD